MLKRFLIACALAMTVGALAGFAMPPDAAVTPATQLAP